MINTKKALQMSSLVKLLIGIISMLVLFYIIYSLFIDDFLYDTSIAECNFLLSQVEGKPAFFENSLNSTSKTFLTAIANTCPAKEVEINKKNIKPATELIKKCWYESGGGVDFLPANFQNEGICIYCGSIYAKDEINNFNDLLQEEIKKEEYEYLFKDNYEIRNLNKEFLKERKLNEQINSKDKSISVFYYIYKPQIPEDADTLTHLRDNVGTKLSETFGDFGGGFSLANYYISSSPTDSFGGVILSSNIKVDFKNDNYNDTINALTDTCKFIIPDKIKER